MKNGIGQLTIFALMGLIATSAIAEQNSPNENTVYTLYRSAPMAANVRRHIATFDASDGHDYNFGNCQIAADLFENQPGVIVEYWCERGWFRK